MDIYPVGSASSSKGRDSIFPPPYGCRCSYQPAKGTENRPLSPRADAVITSSDRAAFGVMTALHRVGLYVPEDIKLISFDNSPYSTMASPAVTALDRKPQQLAEEACRCLLDQMAGRRRRRPSFPSA